MNLYRYSAFSKWRKGDSYFTKLPDVNTYKTSYTINESDTSLLSSIKSEEKLIGKIQFIEKAAGKDPTQFGIPKFENKEVLSPKSYYKVLTI